MRRLIAQTFPAHGVIGEEYGRDRPKAEYVWVLDPIDGTKSFVSGLPTWGTLIGLMHHGQPVYGMMAQPFTRERSPATASGQLRTLAPSHGDGPPSEWATRSLHTRRAPPSPSDARDDEPAPDSRRYRPGGLYAGRKPGPAHPLRRRLLRLLRARSRFRRSRDRDQPQTPRHRRARAIIEGAGGVVTTWDGENAAQGGRIIASGDGASTRGAPAPASGVGRRHGGPSARNTTKGRIPSK